jgi:hypothetical protein
MSSSPPQALSEEDVRKLGKASPQSLPALIAIGLG